MVKMAQDQLMRCVRLFPAIIAQIGAGKTSTDNAAAFGNRVDLPVGQIAWCRTQRVRI